MRPSLIVLCFCAAACRGDEQSSESSPARNAPRVEAPAQAPRGDPSPENRPTPKDNEGKDAAAVLRRYYDHIEAGRTREAWAMRSASDAGYDRFERNFAAYDRYKVSLGPATQPVEAAGWVYVEVPIQIFGTMKGGKGFGSVGNVTMRKAVDIPGATARDRAWHIYTG
ncbi:hypothetical protein [Allosphingosinicella deserti]|uniref:Uncharacterized protein n=1 Tax=Allosphingosinicella deserti TaxID=2116704 RepID=A0A2P7QI06_9SPHN|nr:hypothetical protein [Sphingomonas deserti]PSJ37575.1 hypothetical protein C7I55_21075 [Sphingomonas deserti]